MAPSVLLNDGNVVVDSQHENNRSTQKNIIATKAKASSVLHRSLHSDPLVVTQAKGHYLHLSNGQKIYDATGGAAVSCIGHSDERVQKAMIEQMNEVSYCHSLFYTTSTAEQLASSLIESSHNEMARVFVVSSGSEAMEAALKMARQFHVEQGEMSRTHFIARQQSYHGTTLGALAVGGHVSRRAIYEPLLSTNRSLVSPCYPYRAEDSDNTEQYVARLEAELEAEFQRVGPSNVAAFIAEPVVGAALGCVPSVPGYFAAVQRVCERHGALLVLDEIMSGCGRVGPEPSERYPNPLFAWQDPLVGVVPDIMTMGKGLGGGYMPVACVLANHKVIGALSKGTGAFSHGQTYQGHPIACRAALEVQRILREDNLVANVRRQGKLLEQLLREQIGNHWAVGNIRGKGLFWGIEFVSDKTTKTPFKTSDAVAMGVHELAMERPFSMSVYPGTGSVGGKGGDFVLLCPMYDVTEDEVRNIVKTMAAVIEQFFSKYEGDRQTSDKQ